MPKTKSKKNLSQRRERAFQLFARGYTNTDVKKDLNVSMETVAGYRKLFNERLHAQAAANPNFLSEVVENSMRALEELDHIRADAWQRMEPRKVKRVIECPECEHVWKETEIIEVSDQTRAQYHNVLLKAQDMRAKLFGVLGVKQEIFVAVMNIQVVQNKILEWLAENIEGDTREALAVFLETPEMAAYMGQQPLGVLDLPSEEMPVSA